MIDRPDDDLEVEQRFATLPEWLLRAPISSHAKVLYAVLQRFGNTSGVRMPSQQEIGGWMHCSEATVSRANAELERFGAIRVTRMKRRRSDGSPGQFVTRNRYFLVTSDPTVGHLRPPVRLSPVQDGGSVVRPCKERLSPVTANREITTQPPPTPSVGPRPARPEEEVPAEVLRAIDSVDALCDDLRTARRAAGLVTARWTNRLVRRALRKAFDAGYDPTLMAAALRIIAVDRATATPGRLAHDGPWWSRAEQAVRPAVRPASPEPCRHCDAGWICDGDGLPLERCPHCHPAHRSNGATA